MDTLNQPKNLVLKHQQYYDARVGISSSFVHGIGVLEVGGFGFVLPDCHDKSQQIATNIGLDLLILG